jgi:hypothetical protein
MDNQTILNKANEIVKNATFTGLKKARKNTSALFLIVACGSGLTIYGSYNNENYYAFINANLYQLV